MITFEIVQKIFAKNLGLPFERVRSESTPSDLPGWDSLHHIIIIMEIERELGLQFGLEEVPKLDSVGKIVNAAQLRKPL